MTRCRGTLIQVHYHNRPGGVATVMQEYARAFARACRGSPHANLIICSADVLPGGTTVVDVRDCGYRSFRSRSSFRTVKNRIERALSSVLDDPSLPRPIIVVGHNMNLGKNCALSRAFSNLAGSRCGISGAVRFFSVVHDFAEEGRTDLLSRIQAVGDFGIDVWRDLYPCLPNFRFVTPSPRNHFLLKKAGLPATLLRNPVAEIRTHGLPGACVRKRLFAALRETAKKENVRLDPSRPIVLYPSRVISRKNPVEAVLVAHVIFKSNLLLGANGTSAHDRALSARLKTICTRYGIPVVFDAGRIAGATALGPDSFGLLYGIADACLTTSIAEGFGYALHDPAVYGKKLVGRLPDGCSMPRGLDLYKRLFVPCAWVHIPRLKSRYYDRMKNAPEHGAGLSSFSLLSKQFDTAFIRGRGIDFGCLDAGAQLGILERCIRSPHAAAGWRREFPLQTARLETAFRDACSGRPLAVPAPRRRRRSFEKAFTKCYCRSGGTGRPPHAADPGVLKRHFHGIGHFRPLMAPRMRGSAVPRAVFA
jgi:hypothetical protein